MLLLEVSDLICGVIIFLFLSGHQLSCCFQLLLHVFELSIRNYERIFIRNLFFLKLLCFLTLLFQFFLIFSFCSQLLCFFFLKMLTPTDQFAIQFFKHRLKGFFLLLFSSKLLFFLLELICNLFFVLIQPILFLFNLLHLLTDFCITFLLSHQFQSFFFLCHDLYLFTMTFKPRKQSVNVILNMIEIVLSFHFE